MFVSTININNFVSRNTGARLLPVMDVVVTNVFSLRIKISLDQQN